MTAPTRAARATSCSKNAYGEFDLTWEWRISPGGNSGVKYFVLEDRDAAIGHEYQVIDDAKHADAKIGPHRQTAALYDVLPASEPAGEGRRRVEPEPGAREGDDVEHWLNGTKVLQYELGSPAAGGPPSPRASSRTSSASASRRRATSCCRITATRSATATSRSAAATASHRTSDRAEALSHLRDRWDSPSGLSPQR